MIKVYNTPAGIVEAVNMALKNRLYVSGWQLSGCLVQARAEALWLKSCAAKRIQYVIALKFVDGIPVSIAFHDPNHVPSMMSFCAVKHRRNGFAVACIAATKIQKFTASIGLAESVRLWTKFNVTNFV